MIRYCSKPRLELRIAGVFQTFRKEFHGLHILVIALRSSYCKSYPFLEFENQKQ